ncbi:hypothetical protein N8463_02760 [Synechococcus sp. AH-601-P06]|nr:hypothetical protein [Synechococcus sp. AH-601-P06]
MPIHPTDEPSYLKVETNVGGEWVNLEDTEQRAKDYARNQQREGGYRRYVVEPLPGTQPKQPDAAQVEEVEPNDKLDKAMNEDLRKRGLSNKPKRTRNPKTTD